MGLGVAPFQTSQKKEPSGSPFVAGSANNGLSVDAVTGKIVLGNDLADPAAPAALLSPREIVDGGGVNPITISDAVPANVQDILTSLSQTILDVATGSSIDARSIGGGFMRMIANTIGSVAIIGVTDNAGGQAGLNTGGGTAQIFINNALQSFALINSVNLLFIKNVGGAGNGIEIDPIANDVKSTGTLSTADPGSGIGKWKLGTVVAGAVAPDAANYVEVDIGGVIVKLIKAV